MDEDDSCAQAWKKKKMNDLPHSLEKLTIDQNKKCDKICKCSSNVLSSPSSSTLPNSSSYPIKKCAHFKHNSLFVHKKYKKDNILLSSSNGLSSSHKKKLIQNPILNLKKLDRKKFLFDPKSIGVVADDEGKQTKNNENIFGTKSELYRKLKSFSTNNNNCDTLVESNRYQDDSFKNVRTLLPQNDEDELPHTIINNISSISLQDTPLELSPVCIKSSSVPTCSVPVDTSRSNNNQPCSVQARIQQDDTSMSELASYFDIYCHIPKKMSHMAEMMYI